MRAHYALKKVLDSKAVDFLMSPQAYGIRNIGDTCGDMKPFQSMRMNNIIPVIEDDTRTHNGPYLTFSNNFQTLTKDATIAVMRRNMPYARILNDIFGSDPLEKYQILLRKCGLPESFRDYGLKKDHYDFIIRNCRSGSMKCNPADLSDSDVAAILDEVR